ncbi:MAG TPA: hypothetical protein VKR60_01620 [Candidatus Sulfotelmatobacter sp.]|nr:hypothetical protein [Candidatus Sulfotelmatobacter sp.]
MKNAMRIRVFNAARFKAVLCSAALAAFVLPVVAQTSDPQGAAPASAPVTGQSINQRKENQQDRIANGVKSGQLTAGETSHLEKKESSLNQEEHDMRKLDNGKLTAADKSTLNQQQNKLSNQIYNDKHNSAVQNTDPKSEVGKRAENQQNRIAQGVKSGQLTAGETAHLENNEAKINKEVHNDRAANGGKLTPQERGQVNRQQNRQSRQIYRDKHNGRKQ